MVDLPTLLSDIAARVPGWIEPIAVLAAAVALAFGLVRAVYVLVHRLGIQKGSLTALFLRRARTPLRLAVALIFVALVVPELDIAPGMGGVLRHTVLIIVIILTGWGFLLAVDVLSARSLRRYRIDTDDNLMARKYWTQIRILKRAVTIVAVLLTVGAVMMTFEGVREYGVSLFASAGAAGLVVGFAARPVLANLIAGIQIAITQPIRLEDVVVVEGEWGWIEEIFATYVVVRIWDWRRLVVPLSYFIEQPFQNWTRQSATIMGSVFWWVDYTIPVAEMREAVERIISESPLWDGKVKNLQVVDTTADGVQVRALMSSANSPKNWDLRCEVREKVLDWVQRTHPEALPRIRAEVKGDGPGTGAAVTPPDPRPSS